MVIVCWFLFFLMIMFVIVWSNCELVFCFVVSVCLFCCRFCVGIVIWWLGMCLLVNWGLVCVFFIVILLFCDSRVCISRVVLVLGVVV